MIQANIELLRWISYSASIFLVGCSTKFIAIGSQTEADFHQADRYCYQIYHQAKQGEEYQRSQERRRSCETQADGYKATCEGMAKIGDALFGGNKSVYMNCMAKHGFVPE